MRPVDNNSMIAQMLAARRAVIAQNESLQKLVPARDLVPSQRTTAPEFGDALQSALATVNGLQTQASTLSTEYTTGQTTDIAAVMLAKQKASLGFEATLQVRNKLLGAYQDIMNMPV
ncbi:MAG: flagellar hook-basal body complex protein FliE [Parasphingorhabdus sp.]|nr:flagellar hook-basal body complex protein FliE [Parasphingorhabdus sp.]